MRAPFTHSTPDQREAAEALVRRHHASLRGYLAFLGCPSPWIDDIVQDVFVAVLTSNFEDRGHGTTASYLRKVARSLFLKTLRREGRQSPIDDWVHEEQAWEHYDADDGGERYIDALRECLKKLRSQALRVLDLRYRDRLTRETIAARIGLTESGVKSILARARKRLRGCVERRLAP